MPPCSLEFPTFCAARLRACAFILWMWLENDYPFGRPGRHSTKPPSSWRFRPLSRSLLANHRGSQSTEAVLRRLDAEASLVRLLEHLKPQEEQVVSFTRHRVIVVFNSVHHRCSRACRCFLLRASSLSVMREAVVS